MYNVHVFPSSQIPFDKNELDAILKFGTEDLFKEGDKEEDKALKVIMAEQLHYYQLCVPSLSTYMYMFSVFLNI